jgi:hypothetical protein
LVAAFGKCVSDLKGYPNSFTRTRTFLNAQALNSVFRYECPTAICTVNVLDLVARNGQITAKDPTVTSVLGNIEAAMKTGGTRCAAADPLLDRYVWQSPGGLLDSHPTVRIDHNLTDEHRLGGSFTFEKVTRDPDYSNGADARFPGSPQYRLYTSSRPMMSVWLRSTLSLSVINEAGSEPTSSTPGLISEPPPATGRRTSGLG